MGQWISTRAIDDRRRTELEMLNNDFIEAEIVLKNLQFAQDRALKLVRRQEQFSWEFLGISTMTVILLVAGALSKRKDFAVPIAPLIMTLGYRYDCAFGANHEVVRDNAEALLKKKDDRLKMVGGPLTLKEIDAYREKHF